MIFKTWFGSFECAFPAPAGRRKVNGHRARARLSAFPVRGENKTREQRSGRSFGRAQGG